MTAFKSKREYFLQYFILKNLYIIFFKRFNIMAIEKKNIINFHYMPRKIILKNDKLEDAVKMHYNFRSGKTK